MPGDRQPELGFLFRLYKGKGTRGWGSSEQGSEEYTVENVYPDIKPVRVPQPLYGEWLPEDRAAPAVAGKPEEEPPVR